MMKRFVVVLLALLIAGTAHASFQGTTIQATIYFPDLSSPWYEEVAVVGPGAEFTNFPAPDPVTNIDISSANILITYFRAASWSADPFNGPVFEAQTPIPPITGVFINPATNMVGLDVSRISFTPNSVSINWNGLSFDASTIVSLDVMFSEPIPTLGESALVTLIVSIGALGVFILRRIADDECHVHNCCVGATHGCHTSHHGYH